MTIFIDVDNTLLDFDACANKSIELACAKFGVPYTTRLVDVFHPINLDLWHRLERKEITKEQLFQVRFNKVFDVLGIDCDGHAFEDAFHKNLFETAIKIDGAEQLLKYLHSKFKVYVASNATLAQQQNRLKNADLLKYIDGIFVSEEIGYPKPQKAFFDACFASLPDANPSDTLMIGDSVSADINGAREYGMKTLWYNHRHESTDGVECDFVADNLYQIVDLIEKLDI